MRRKSKVDREEASSRERSLRQRQDEKIQMASESFSGSSGCRQSEGMTVGIHPRF